MNDPDLNQRRAITIPVSSRRAERGARLAALGEGGTTEPQKLGTLPESRKRSSPCSGRAPLHAICRFFRHRSGRGRTGCAKWRNCWEKYVLDHSEITSTAPCP